LSITVTTIAFFFFPISLSSSIFGMNLRPLNGTGMPLRVFIFTNIGIFASLVALWALSYQYYKHRPLPKGQPNFEHRTNCCRRDDMADSTSSKMKVHWRIRLWLFLPLIAHGHAFWAWRSGIIFSLITSGRTAFIASCHSAYKEHELSTETRNYLEKHMCSTHDDTYSPLNCHPCVYIALHLDTSVNRDGSTGCCEGFKCRQLSEIV
jgi:hypothetical protein